MELQNILRDDRAVSPVIGVILMVAITVILAAVIGSFVLQLGNNVGGNAPQATIDFNYGSGSVSIVHAGGATLDGETLSVSESNTSADGGTDSGATVAAGTYKAGDELASGSHDPRETFKLIWADPDGDSTQVIAESTAP